MAAHIIPVASENLSATSAAASESVSLADHTRKPNRKPAAAATRNPQTKQNIMPCMGVQEQIVDAAHELAMEDDSREISAVLARRFGFSESMIDRVICRHSYAHKRAYHAQRNGILNAMSIAGSVLRKTREA